MAAQAWVFPGQGSQRKGMGKDLLDRFPGLVATADGILGYSVRELCQADPDGHLRQTQYAQPALYVVNALAYLAHASGGGEPAFFAGHSLGEYSALFAAGCFDFPTGLRLVRRRGELMAAASGGGMAAVLGLASADLAGLLAQAGAAEIDIANYNSPAQAVISGPQPALRAFSEAIAAMPGVRLIPLNVSAAFHSRYMAQAATGFREFALACAFSPPRVPVVANVTARPYPAGATAELLVRQLCEPVLWWDSMCYLSASGVDEITELGPGRVLTDLWRSAPKPAPAARRETTPAAREAAAARETTPAGQEAAPTAREAAPAARETTSAGATARRGPIRPEQLGSGAFRRDYGIRCAYLAGSMYHGIASADLVIALAKAGLMGFFGTGGLPLATVEEAILAITGALGPDAGFGMNLLHAIGDPELEDATVGLFLRHDVRFVEAAGFTQITPALVRFRFAGARLDQRGRPVAVRHLLAKASRPEVAAAFMRPAPQAIVDRLAAAGQLAPDEAEAARLLPVSDDLCVESDSGGHTDAGVALALLPSLIRLRDQIAAEQSYPGRIRVGAAGGLGAPEALAAAFVLGADFVVTGSVNQCSPEAGTSADVKDMLAGIDVQDTTYTAAGDMFELGARVQVLRKGTLFPARANKLYQLYRSASSLDDIDQRARRTIEQTYFRRGFDEVWRQVIDHYSARPAELDRAERDPRHKMALVFRWYFGHTTQLALRGVSSERVNYQVHCGPAAGAFNRLVSGTDLADWRLRHVDVIADLLMEGAAEVLSARLSGLAGG